MTEKSNKKDMEKIMKGLERVKDELRLPYEISKAMKVTMQDFEKAKSELWLLYEISNAMRTTLELEEILYIILTAVTSHEGLGFNRAMLFLVSL